METLVNEFSDLQAALFEAVVEPLAFALGLGHRLAEAYGATGWLLVGLLQLAVLLVVVGSLLGVSSGMLLVSSDPRDLISSPLFEAQQSVDLHGLVLTDLDAENSTGGEPVEGVQVELLHLADDTSEARTQTGPDGRFTFTDLPRKEMLLRVTHAGNVTIERTLVPGDLPEVTLTLRVGEGVDERDLPRLITMNP